MIAHLFSILYFYQIQVFLAIFQEQAFSKSQVKIPGGGQRDCATLATVKQLLTENNDIMCTASLWKIYHHDVHTGWFYNHLTKVPPCSFLWRHHLLPNSRPRILLHQLLPKTGAIPSSLPPFWLKHTPNPTWRTGVAQLQLLLPCGDISAGPGSWFTMLRLNLDNMLHLQGKLV